jgi:hypothetical protein
MCDERMRAAILREELRMVDYADAPIHSPDDGNIGIRVPVHLTENFADRDKRGPIVRFRLPENEARADCASN